jgi:CheY-like chemotaxis protein
MVEFVPSPELPTLLLIDDDMVSREVMATILTMSGYAVHTAATGAASVQMLTAGDCVPGLILMDAQMPDLSGAALVKELRARSKARLIAISASTPPYDVIAAADGFLLKPFTVDALHRLLEGQESLTAPESDASGDSSKHGWNFSFDPAEPVVDPETLRKLREMMPESAVRQIYVAIIEDLRKRLAALEVAIPKGDADEVRRIGHSIKGGCGMAGALQAAHLGKLLESGALELPDPAPGRNQLDNSSSVLNDLRATTRNLERMLEAEFSG